MKHKGLLQGRLADEDLVTSERRLLGYDSLWNPVFRLNIEGKCCIIMLDTGATCNLAFPSLLKKFPTLKLLPCGQVVNGVGGLSKPISGKLFITMSIGSQTLTCPFLFDDHQISNLDGLMGTGTLKHLLSWSVGGSPSTGAFLELNGLHIRLMGYGVRKDQAVTITFLEHGDGEFSSQTPNELYTGSQGKGTPTLSFPEIKNAFIPNNQQPTIICNGTCEDRTAYQCAWSESDTIVQTDKEILTWDDSHDIIHPTEGDLILTARIKDMEEGNGSHWVDKMLVYTCSQCDTIINSYEGTCSCQSNSSLQQTPNLKKLYQETSTSSSSLDTSKTHKKGPEPIYSALFLNSQWQPRLTVEENDNYDDRLAQPIYATQSGHLPPHCSANIIVQMEGRTKCGNFLFVPYFDNQPNLVMIGTQGLDTTTLRVENHTDRDLFWDRGKRIGTLERTGETLTPTHVCTGDSSWGKEDTGWYTGKQSHDIFNTLVSTNQQIHYFDGGNGLLVAGPAPDPVEVCNVTLSRPTIDKLNTKPITVAGDLTNRFLFGQNDIIAHQINACTSSSHGLGRALENSYSYGSVYSKKVTKDNILPDDRLRPVGECMLLHDQNPNNPHIANIIGQFFYGRAIDDRGRQEDYLSKFADKCSPLLRKQLSTDTKANRLRWFQRALDNLYNSIKNKWDEGDNTIMRVFFPNLVGCANSHGDHRQYMRALEDFTKLVAQMDIVVYLVVTPTENDKKYGNKYPLIESPRTPISHHTAGQYRDAPTHFCKDPTCKGCRNNKTILELLDQEVDEENSNHPIHGIIDGMSPDSKVPSATSEVERQQIFEEMLKTVRIGDLDPEQTERVKNLLRDCSRLFITSDNEPAGLIKGLEVDIPTSGPPISCKRRKFSPKALKIMEDINEVMQRKCLTRPCDGPWSSPVVLVKKKAVPGQVLSPDDLRNNRFRIDYRRINEQSIIWKAYPVSDMKQQLQKAAGFRYYSTVDIKDAFHCVALRSPSQPVTAFALPSGLWCFTRLPFGLSISPQIWARAADTMLRPVKDVCSYYADDIVCHSLGFDEHLSDLRRVLEELITSGVKVQLGKCVFFMEKVSWLGHTLSREGISPDPQGVETVQNLGPAKNVKELRSIIGTLNYFKDFIDKYSDIVAPMSALLKKNVPFQWGEEQNKALQVLKDVLSSDRVLVKPNFMKPFYLQCDASDLAVSAILSQMDETRLLRPIQYWSKKLDKSELNYGASEKEALAVFLAFKKFEPYLQLNTTHVLTDASVLKAFYGSKEAPNKRIQRWALYVGEFQHTITHVRGHDNDLADMCSRLVRYPTDQVCSLVATAQGSATPSPINTGLIKKLQEKEAPWMGLLDSCKRGVQTESEADPIKRGGEYTLNEQGLLCLKDRGQFGVSLRVVVPTKLIPLVLYWNHDSVTTNHQGFDRTLKRIRQSYFWPKMIKDTELYVLSCQLCQQYKESIPYFNCKVHPLKMIPEAPGEILCMDIAHLPRSTEGFTAALVIVDLFSRLVVACPLRDMTANEITKAITNHCCHNGFPSILYTDRAGAFKKALQDDCSHLLKVKHDTSIPWRHCSNISERYIRMVKDGLKLVLPVGKFGWWARYIKFVVFAINTSHCRSIGMTPFEAYHSRKPLNRPALGDLQLNTQYVFRHEDWLQTLRESVKETSVTMKGKYLASNNAGNTKPEGSLEVGDMVMIKRQAFMPGFPDKLQTTREGPLVVKAIRGTEVDLEFAHNDQGENRTRHISQIAPYYNRPERLMPERVMVNDEPEISIEARTPIMPEITPGILYDKLSNLVDDKHLLVVGIDSLSREPSTDTIMELTLEVTSFYPYEGSQQPRGKDEWKKHFSGQMRAPSSFKFTKGRTRGSSNAIVCSMVTRAYDGIPPRVGSMPSLPLEYQQAINEDTIENRQKWLLKALENLASYLAENEVDHPASKQIFIEGEMLTYRCDTSHTIWGSTSEISKQAIGQFAWQMKTMGLSTTLVWRQGNDDVQNQVSALTLPFSEIEGSLLEQFQ